jgi:hypothetical protein
MTPHQENYQRLWDKIESILDWARENPHFDEGFVLKMQQQLLENENLTRNQQIAINNIIEKWRVPQ